MNYKRHFNGNLKSPKTGNKYTTCKNLCVTVKTIHKKIYIPTFLYTCYRKKDKN